MKKKINKSIAFIMSLIVGFSTVPAAYAGLAGENYVDLLEKINVIDKEMNIAEDATVTRAQFIRMVVNILCNEVSDREAESPFADVAIDNENYKYIRTAYEYGIISGDGSGNFNPDSPIKYNDAIKILVELLGYREYAMIEGGYPGGYLNVATDIKLTKSVTSTDNFLKGQDAARLIYNALDSNTVVKDTHGSSYEMTPSGDKLMTETMDLYSVKGILTADGFTGLYDVDGAGKNSVVIGGTQINIFNSLDAEKYLGYDVECFYRSDDESDVVMAIVASNKNNVTEIKSEEFESFTGSEITYMEDGKSRQDKVSLDDNLFVIVNGRVEDDYNAKTFEINEGTITVIDNNGDKKGDVIHILSYRDYVIAAVDSEEELIYDSYGKILDLSTEKASKSVVIADAAGNEIPFSKLSKEQVLSVVADSEGNYIRAILSSDNLTGKISGSYEEDGEMRVNINNTEYTLSKDIKEAYFADYKPGESGSFLINAFGKISYFKKSAADAVYAMVINAFINEDTDRVFVKYIDHYGAIETLQVSEKCRINGQRIKNNREILDTIGKKELVMLSLSTGNEIVAVETADGTVLHQISEKVKSTYSGAQRWFGGKLTLQETTPIIVYPVEDSTNEEDFFVARYNYMSEMSVCVQGFNQNKQSYLPDVLTMEKPTGADTIQYNSTNIIVEKVKTKLDYNDEVIYSIAGYTFAGAPVEYKVKDKSVLENHKLLPGDMIKIKRDIKDYITQLDKFYDSQKGNIASGSKYVSSSANAGFKPYVGYVYENNGTMFGISSKSGESTYDDVTYFRFGTATVLVCEVNEKGTVEVKTGSLDMITDYLNNSNPTKIFMYTQNAIIQKIIILK